MAVISLNNIVMSVVLPIIFSNTCDAIKCFECNSANNSACLEMHIPRMHAIIPIVDCSRTLPSEKNKDTFCRKITQTILHNDKTPEVRITRTCGWVKHKRECYKADNSDHLETVCQCFGDMCNGATTLGHLKMTALTTVAALLTTLQKWRGCI